MAETSAAAGRIYRRMNVGIHSASVVHPAMRMKTKFLSRKEMRESNTRIPLRGRVGRTKSNFPAFCS